MNRTARINSGGPTPLTDGIFADAVFEHVPANHQRGEEEPSAALDRVVRDFKAKVEDETSD